MSEESIAPRSRRSFLSTLAAGLAIPAVSSSAQGQSSPTGGNAIARSFGKISTGPTFHDGVLYVAHGEAPQVLTGLSRSEGGEFTTTFNTSLERAIAAPPMPHPNGVVMINATGTLVSISPEGDINWQDESPGSMQRFPTMTQSGLYLTQVSGRVVKLSNDGTEQWGEVVSGTFGQSPTVSPDGTTVYSVTKDGAVIAMDTTGEIIERKETVYNPAASPVALSNGVVFPSKNGTVVGFSADLSEQWTTEVSGNIIHDPVVVGGKAVITTASTVQAFTAQGDKDWSHEYRNEVSLQPTTSGDLVYVPSRSGKLRVFNSNGAQTEQIRLLSQSRRNTFGPPVGHVEINGGNLYFVQEQGYPNHAGMPPSAVSGKVNSPLGLVNRYVPEIAQSPYPTILLLAIGAGLGGAYKTGHIEFELPTWRDLLSSNIRITSSGIKLIQPDDPDHEAFLSDLSLPRFMQSSSAPEPPSGSPAGAAGDTEYQAEDYTHPATKEDSGGEEGAGEGELPSVTEPGEPQPNSPETEVIETDGEEDVTWDGEDPDWITDVHPDDAVEFTKIGAQFGDSTEASPDTTDEHPSMDPITEGDADVAEHQGTDDGKMDVSHGAENVDDGEFDGEAVAPDPDIPDAEGGSFGTAETELNDDWDDKASVDKIPSYDISDVDEGRRIDIEETLDNPDGVSSGEDEEDGAHLGISLEDESDSETAEDQAESQSDHGHQEETPEHGDGDEIPSGSTDGEDVEIMTPESDSVGVIDASEEDDSVAEQSSEAADTTTPEKSGGGEDALSQELSGGAEDEPKIPDMEDSTDAPEDDDTDSLFNYTERPTTDADTSREESADAANGDVESDSVAAESDTVGEGDAGVDIISPGNDAQQAPEAESSDGSSDDQLADGSEFEPVSIESTETDDTETNDGLSESQDLVHEFRQDAFDYLTRLQEAQNDERYLDAEAAAKDLIELCDAVMADDSAREAVNQLDVEDLRDDAVFHLEQIRPMIAKEKIQKLLDEADELIEASRGDSDDSYEKSAEELFEQGLEKQQEALEIADEYSPSRADTIKMRIKQARMRRNL